LVTPFVDVYSGQKYFRAPPDGGVRNWRNWTCRLEMRLCSCVFLN